MTKRTKMMIASAAIAGLLTGSLPIGASASNLPDGKAGIELAKKKEKNDKNACAGKNSCKGKGGCKTDKNECKGKNDCKGKGGCATDGSKDKAKKE